MNTRLKLALAIIGVSAVAGTTAYVTRSISLHQIERKKSIVNIKEEKPEPAKSDAVAQVATPPLQQAQPKQQEKPEPQAAASTTDSVVAADWSTFHAETCRTSKDGVMKVCVGAGFLRDDGLTVSYDNPTSIYGTTTAFENTAQWKVKDEKGTVISKGFFNVASPDVGIPGPFSAWMFYDATPKSSTGTLMVYEASAKDGQPIHQVTFPVHFLYRDGKFGGCDHLSGSEIPVYWSNSKKQKDQTDCTELFPVSHLVCGDWSSSQLMAVHELLKGPTAWEKSQGYTTNLPSGLITPEIHWKDGKRFLDFPSGFEDVAGSCRIAAIRAQVNNTVGMEMGIGVRGETENILQP